MPRFHKIRDGHAWGWSDVQDAEDMPRSLAHSVLRDRGNHDPSEAEVSAVAATVKVYRYGQSNPLAGKVSRVEHGSISRRPYWVAERRDDGD